jgi:hypothetical protein
MMMSPELCHCHTKGGATELSPLCKWIKKLRMCVCVCVLRAQARSTVFWNITSCSALLAACFRAGIFLELLFYPEDGGHMFIRNVCWLSTDYMALYLHNHRCENLKAYLFLCNMFNDAFSSSAYTSIVLNNRMSSENDWYECRSDS